MSTAEITDATPAAPMAHVRALGCQGPANMAACPQDAKHNGGPGSIAEQSIEREVDVILGGGRSRYLQTITGGPYAGQTVVAQAQAEGYDYVTDATGLAATGPGDRVLGLFNAGILSVEWGGPGRRGRRDRCAAGLPRGTTTRQ